MHARVMANMNNNNKTLTEAHRIVHYIVFAGHVVEHFINYIFEKKTF